MERALKSFTDKFSSPLGPWAEEIIDDDHDTIREERQRLLEAENPLKQTEALAAERKKTLKRCKSLENESIELKPGLMPFKRNKAPKLKVKQNFSV